MQYEPVADEVRLDAAPKNGSHLVVSCIFCHGPNAEVAYAWPDWLCRFLAEHQGMWCAERVTRHADLVMVERAEHEADKTIDCVCRTCRDGWMQRLEDNVRPFLESMIVGDPTPLPTARRKLLARWAAKTAMLMECASDSSLRTPSFASEHVRKVGVHAGTQVLVGRYAGRLQMLTSERDAIPRTVGSEVRHLSQTTLVMGNVLVQVYADPWRDDPPELTENATQPLIPLIGNHRPRVVWPPDSSVDDTLYDLMRLGAGPAAPVSHGSYEVQEGRQPIMANHDATGSAEPRISHSGNGTGDRPSSALPTLAPSTAPEMPGALLPEAPTWSASSGEAGPAADDARANPGPKRRMLAVAAIALVVVVGLLGFGLQQRSNASRSRSKAATAQRRNRALEAAISVKNRQLQASQASVDQLNARVTALTSGKHPATNSPGLLTLANAVPSATDGLRRCAGSALQTASDALDFAAAFPTSAARVNASATAVASACGQATAAANTLDNLADAAKR